jgi:hypothetical protein
MDERVIIENIQVVVNRKHSEILHCGNQLSGNKPGMAVKTG